VQAIDQAVLQGFRPDLTLVFDLDPAVGLARATLRGKLDRFESEHQAFFDRVRQGFLSQLKAAPERYYLIDASQSLVDVQQQLIPVLLRVQQKLNVVNKEPMC